MEESNEVIGLQEIIQTRRYNAVIARLTKEAEAISSFNGLSSDLVHADRNRLHNLDIIHANMKYSKTPKTLYRQRSK